jgi:catechol 2,3-dioxygenase-like lactoylglutathione lyase family enzyme
MLENLPAVHALIRFGMNSPNARRLLQFYEQACGARLQRSERKGNDALTPDSRTGGRVQSTVLRLGDTSVELWEFDAPGRPYPDALSPYDTRFQHLGIVVTDMRLAMERLAQTDGWSAISTGGPQNLPPDDGGVTAFKFRDPDGHPLEFLQFPKGNVPAHWRDAGGVHQGVDHSALSVSDAGRSVRFYESLGLRTSNRTLNQGAAQERLDGVAAPTVDVIGLAPARATPHVELLHYHASGRPTHDPPALNDIAATRLIFAAEFPSGNDSHRLIQDPDGHFLQFDTFKI